MAVAAITARWVRPSQHAAYCISHKATLVGRIVSNGAIGKIARSRGRKEESCDCGSSKVSEYLHFGEYQRKLDLECKAAKPRISQFMFLVPIHSAALLHLSVTGVNHGRSWHRLDLVCGVMNTKWKCLGVAKVGRELQLRINHVCPRTRMKAEANPLPEAYWLLSTPLECSKRVGDVQNRSWVFGSVPAQDFRRLGNLTPRNGTFSPSLSIVLFFPR